MIWYMNGVGLLYERSGFVIWTEWVCYIAHIVIQAFLRSISRRYDLHDPIHLGNIFHFVLKRKSSFHKEVLERLVESFDQCHHRTNAHEDFCHTNDVLTTVVIRGLFTASIHLFSCQTGLTPFRIKATRQLLHFIPCRSKGLFPQGRLLPIAGEISKHFYIVQRPSVPSVGEKGLIESKSVAGCGCEFNDDSVRVNAVSMNVVYCQV